jgi:hypothetical protein
MAVALPDQADEIAYVSFLDFMDALRAPVSNHVAPQEIRDSPVGSDLRHVFSNEGLDQIVDAICHQATP